MRRESGSAGDQPLHRVVRTALGHHRLPYPHRQPDHGRVSTITQPPPSVTLFFRTVPILPEGNGRVAEIFVGSSGSIAKGRRSSGSTAPSRRPPPKPRGARLRKSMRRSTSRKPTPRRPTANCARPGRAAAGAGRARDQTGAAPAQSRHRAFARHREASGRGRREPRRGRGGDGRQSRRPK
jgi:hypothetical protein